MATYVNNLRLKEIATGAESGTWGTSTNTNLELIADAFGSGTEAITTNADTHTTTVADGAADEGRAIYMKYTGTLDSACTITLAPNTINKFWIVENATSGSQNIIISQGSGANITIGNGNVSAIFTDGAGSGAAVLDALADLELSSTLTVAGASTLTGAVIVAAGITMTGTTPTLTIGDAGTEDTKIVFDGSAQDYYVGLDDTDDDLKIGLGSTVGTTPAITIDENQNTTITQDLTVSGIGPHSIGGAASAGYGFQVVGAAGTVTAASRFSQSLTGSVDTGIFGVWMSPTITEAASGTHDIVTSLRVDEPAIVNASATTTLAATVYISSAPTEGGTTNAALYVAAGAVIAPNFQATAAVNAVGSMSFESNILIYQGGTGGHQWNNAADNAALLSIMDAGGVAVPATHKLYLDGGGDTYTTEVSANVVRTVIGGTTILDAASGSYNIQSSDLMIAATKKFYLDGGGNTYIVENSANVIRCVAGGSGGVDLLSGATAWASASDERLKTDLKPIVDALTKVSSLRSVTGRFKDDDSDFRRSFLIAQDVQKVLPEAVTRTDDGELTLRYTEVIPLLVAAINELEARVATLNPA